MTNRMTNRMASVIVVAAVLSMLAGCSLTDGSRSTPVTSSATTDTSHSDVVDLATTVVPVPVSISPPVTGPPSHVPVLAGTKFTVVDSNAVPTSPPVTLSFDTGSTAVLRVTLDCAGFVVTAPLPYHVEPVITDGAAREGESATNQPASPHDLPLNGEQRTAASSGSASTGTPAGQFALVLDAPAFGLCAAAPPYALFEQAEALATFLNGNPVIDFNGTDLTLRIDNSTDYLTGTAAS